LQPIVSNKYIFREKTIEISKSSSGFRRIAFGRLKGLNFSIYILKIGFPKFSLTKIQVDLLIPS